jgi:catechol 2,3-dioxygenase-like lactoylglutathione lyase family enzyme
VSRAAPPRACHEARVVGTGWHDAPIDEEAIPILRVADAAASVAWYARLGFTQQWVHRFEPGLPAFVEVARGHVKLFLSEHTGDARPDTLIYLRVHDVDAVGREFDAEVRDVPWGREVELRDPDGNRLRVGTPPAR